MSFITLGPATLKETICIGEDERTKDIFPSFGMRSHLLLSPNTLPQAYALLMAFDKLWSYFTLLKGIPESYFPVATVLELVQFPQGCDRLS